MDIRLKEKIKKYIYSIYTFDIVVVSIITAILLSGLGDYISINKYHEVIESYRLKHDIIGLSILGVIYFLFMIKGFIVFKRDTDEPKIKSVLFNNVIFVIKKGFHYKETRKYLIVSIALALSLLITYLYFLATGGYENNIFVRFFRTYPFKGSVFMITMLFLSSIYGVKKTLDIVVVNDGLKKLSQGQLQEDLELESSPVVKELIVNINSIKEGYKEILDEAVKNEKLKTELISNVSHDLKTPLTSIINYVNILKSGDITEEEREEYLMILEKKSLKLKVLIEDLFEMSKINSGKIKLNKDLIDILSLIHQGIGEYSTLYEDKNIVFKVNTKEEVIYMQLDGRMMSRALENIIINALKYSMHDTRVYIDVDKDEDNVRIAVKNIANYEMDFDENEIFERFARGDKSRNSKVEGSGLGLAITKSIVELHGGKINIKTEGDMFKIYLTLPITNG